MKICEGRVACCEVACYEFNFKGAPSFGSSAFCLNTKISAFKRHCALLIAYRRINIYWVQNANMRWQSSWYLPCSEALLLLGGDFAPKGRGEAHSVRLVTTRTWRFTWWTPLQWHFLITSHSDLPLNAGGGDSWQGCNSRSKSYLSKAAHKLYPLLPVPRHCRAGCTRGLTRDKR